MEQLAAAYSMEPCVGEGMIMNHIKEVIEITYYKVKSSL